ncbi:hypothetical protein [Aestuariibaculum suncheonense]|uniref:DUF4832 domain-containing protein n=1 Tax=Aestuariibaculum suncheonense TaxID=1028745 RepID=A0A8J6UAE0_9FLAO|nr:hypothetical protein [Aestuariibaculum suncheonense]MBD0834750.1 hypothetical protein [Aestuariibaculum suncheonense]
MKKNVWSILLLGVITFILSSCSSGDDEPNKPSVDTKLTTKEYVPLTKGIIRNPGMGWTLYDAASVDEMADAGAYWAAQDQIARDYASCFYLRWRWSDMEPEEGKYAWEYDANFKALIQGALDRGLRLSFRVFVNGRDNLRPATPQFVFDAGAEGYEVAGANGGTNLTPYPDDPIFQEKFTNFVKAFAQEFDDPNKVDYVDGYNLGWWGEGHNIKFKNVANMENTFKWIINLYGNSFKKVPLIITIDSQVGLSLEKTYAYEGQGYSPRRDGYASYWFPESQKQLLRSFFPDRMVVAEAAYWGNNSITYANNTDQLYSWNSWADYYKQVVSEALSTHANYLDLRETVEASRYVRLAKDQVDLFIEKGGYRIYPQKVSYSESVAANKNLEIEHSWENIAQGVLPNNDRRWNFKYKVAFTLLNNQGTIVKKWISEKAEPSDWVNTGGATKYTESLSVSSVSSGTYKLALAIVDTTQGGNPAINLAVEQQLVVNGWLQIGNVEIE